MTAFELPQFLPFAAALLATGLLAGVLAGLLGVGGGIVIVPVLYHLFTLLGLDEAIRMHLAVGTSLATIIPTSIRSIAAHHKRGAFDAALFRAWAPGMFAGVVVGSWLASESDFIVLAAVFGVVAMVVSLHMGFGKSDWHLRTSPPRGAGAALLASVIGGISTMMGIGGGTLGVPVLTLCGFPIHRAVGTAAGFGILIAAPGMLGLMAGGWSEPGLPRFSVGYVNWLCVLLIVPGTVLATPLGARLAHSLDPLPLRRVFALFLGGTAVRMLWDVSGSL